MGNLVMDQAAVPYVEKMLRAELARGDRALSGVAPVLSHMLASSGHALVNDDIVARVRGMLNDCARQLITAASPESRAISENPIAIDALADDLTSSGPILSHFYALAMEGHLIHRLEQRSAIDPVLSPLLQELIASDRPDIADLAMRTLAAQSRFVQNQRRMALPISELPARLFKTVLDLWVSSPQLAQAELNLDIDSASKILKASYDEAATRLGLFARLSASMGGGAVAGLELDHAGLALFATSLAALTRQPRDLAVLSCHERQSARLALCLRAAGLDEAAIERQFMLLEPAERLPKTIGEIAPGNAADLLGQSAVWKGV